MSLTIVVGTGRCGSTMLTRILHMHPEVLSLSEYWNVFSNDEEGIPTRDMSGEEFWQRISKPDTYGDAFVLAGINSDRNYPVDRSRFDHATGVPAICDVLASLTDDPDALYDKLAGEVPAWPSRSASNHSRALFTELATTLGRHVIVERTGGSAGFLPTLRQQFPEARLVFMYRDGPDCALSMSRYFVYRFAAIKILTGTVKASEEWEISLPMETGTVSPSDFEGLVSPPFDKERFMAYPVPLTFYAEAWSYMMYSGMSVIRKASHEEWMPLRYEHLLNATQAELTKLAHFIGITAEQQWLDRASEYVDARRSGKALTRLHPSDLAALRAICLASTKTFERLESEHAASVKPSF